MCLSCTLMRCPLAGFGFRPRRLWPRVGGVLWMLRRHRLVRCRRHGLYQSQVLWLVRVPMGQWSQRDHNWQYLASHHQDQSRPRETDSTTSTYERPTKTAMEPRIWRLRVVFTERISGWGRRAVCFRSGSPATAHCAVAIGHWRWRSWAPHRGPRRACRTACPGSLVRRPLPERPARAGC